MEEPAQMAVLAITEVEEGSEMVSELVWLQPVAVIVSVSMYPVVAVGLTDGFDEVEVKPDGELVHEYESPETDAAPIETEPPGQMAVLAMTDAAGNGFVVTLTELAFLHPVAVIISVREYVVVPD